MGFAYTGMLSYQAELQIASQPASAPGNQLLPELGVSVSVISPDSFTQIVNTTTQQ